jgi:hypothetical protein
VVDHEHDYGADHANEYAVQVEAGDAGKADGIRNEAADNGTDDSQNDVHEHPFALFVDQLAGNKSGDEAHDEPGKKSHTHAPFEVRRHVG